MLFVPLPVQFAILNVSVKYQRHGIIGTLLTMRPSPGGPAMKLVVYFVAMTTAE